MILILANVQQSAAVTVYEVLKNNPYQMPVVYATLEGLVREGGITVEADGDAFHFTLNDASGNFTLHSSQIKVCYIPDGLYTAHTWFPYEKDYDLEYAQGEWYAMLRTMVGAHPGIKWINPIERHLDLFSRLEQVLLMQRFGLKTVDMVLTNHAEEALKRYEQWNHEVCYQSVRQNFSETTVLEEKDLTRFDRLHLSPAVFQQLTQGGLIHVCQLGDTALAVQLVGDETRYRYEYCTLPEALTQKIADIARYLNTPWLEAVFFHQPETDDYYGTMLNYPYFDKAMQIYPGFAQAMADYLLKEART